ncbi:hypothetical protein FIBSPDRAFT_904487 [Athelia psychrophila]|uniref:Uncharacterized protein n=1 Tax=Athelia psychrophila TaxID=1759441 RepID=A0A167UPW0_9AGAM|nr:hypothetical protein FIBSPDRAFT_904487 [Fibularhizoctonia sp. CBS 109695]
MTTTTTKRRRRPPIGNGLEVLFGEAPVGVGDFVCSVERERLKSRKVAELLKTVIRPNSAKSRENFVLYRAVTQMLLVLDHPLWGADFRIWILSLKHQFVICGI